MKTLHVLLLLLSFMLPFETAAQGKRSGVDSLALLHVNVIDVNGGPTRRDMTVIVVGDRIARIGVYKNTKLPTGSNAIDATGKYLIPGLWDMHVHVFNNVSGRVPNEYYFPMFIANGVTSVRDMWTKPAAMPQVQAWRKQFADKPGTVPRFAAVGTLIDGTPAIWPNSDTVATADEARAMVRTIKAAGLDFVKVYGNLSRESYFAISDESRKLGIPFSGHVPFEIVVSETAAAGQRSIEHLTGLSKDCATFVPEMEKELANAKAFNSPESIIIQKALDTCDPAKAFAMYQDLAKNGVWQVPTFPILNRREGEYTDFVNDLRNKYIPEPELRSWDAFSAKRKNRSTEKTVMARKALARDLDTVSIMHKAGVRFMAGTDVGNEYVYAGFSLHDDLASFVKAGFTPMEALQTATRNPAEFLGMTENLGTVDKGKFADMVLLDADPLVDIGNTRKINAVIVNGKYLSRAELDAMLARVELVAHSDPSKDHVQQLELSRKFEDMYKEANQVEMANLLSGDFRYFTNVACTYQDCEKGATKEDYIKGIQTERWEKGFSIKSVKMKPIPSIINSDSTGAVNKLTFLCLITSVENGREHKFTALIDFYFRRELESWKISKIENLILN
jgi:Amidohydrolase family